MRLKIQIDYKMVIVNDFQNIDVVIKSNLISKLIDVVF